MRTLALSVLALASLAALGCPASPPPSAPSPSPSPSPSLAAAPSPSLDPEPTPSLAPSPTPTPSPEPAPSPTPEVAPVESKAPPGPPRPVSEGGVTRFPGLRIFPDEDRIEVEGLINLNRCPTLEFMGCTTRGKTHETLLRFECDPKHLHLALLMLGLEPTPQVDEEGQRIALDKGERVTIEVAWWDEHSPEGDDSAPEAQEGVMRRRVEDLIFDQRRQDAMPRVGWVFTGSRMIKIPTPPDWETLKEVYAASYEGNVAAVYHHPHVILDTPLIEGGDDTVYVPFTERIPKRGTPVTIHIQVQLPPPGEGGAEAPGGEASPAPVTSPAQTDESTPTDEPTPSETPEPADAGE